MTFSNLLCKPAFSYIKKKKVKKSYALMLQNPHNAISYLLWTVTIEV